MNTIEKTINTFVVLLALFLFISAEAVLASQPGARDRITQNDGESRKWKEKKEAELQTLDELFSLYQPYLDNISAYDPIYFLVGTSPEESKFQLSFKYRPFNPEGDFAGRYTWLDDIYLAYTQTVFWDLTSASRPFEDTSYKPELFYRTDNLTPKEGRSWHIFLQAGLQHESNGRGGDVSRSTNFLYLKPFFILFQEQKRNGLQIVPRIWIYVANEDENNPDLKDYRGYCDLELKGGRADGLVVESRLRYAEKGASWQLDLTYPLHRVLGGNLDIYLQAQYVNSLAESLLHYRQRTKALRFGIAIIR